jgi:hypothetical protein
MHRLAAAAFVAVTACSSAPDARTCSPDRAAGQAWCQSAGKRVLVLDEMTFRLELGDHVFGAYARREHGGFEHVDPATFRPARPNPHGDSFANLMAKFSPDAQAIVAHVVGPSLPPCSAAEIARELDRDVADIKAIVATHRIDFINHSRGHTRAVVLEELAHCNPSPALVDEVLRVYLDHWYRPLGTIDRVLFVQAAPNIDEIQSLDEAPTDCATIPHRLRVGTAAIEPARVPAEGLAWSAFEKELHPAMKNLEPCVDVYLNVPDMAFPTSGAAPLTVGRLLTRREGRSPLEVVQAHRRQGKPILINAW